jgi:hypothetical protein
LLLRPLLLLLLLCLVCAWCVLQDPELSAVLLGEDVAAMQQMLKSAYQVRTASSSV